MHFGEYELSQSLIGLSLLPSHHQEAPTACMRTVSVTISLSCLRCFSPFLHSTGSLSVSCEYLALADGPAGFTQDFSCPALLRVPLRFA